MQLGPLLPTRLLGRRKRFFADIALPDGSNSVAHCANTGSMAGLLDGEPVAWVRDVTSPTRKLQWSLELLQRPEGFALVNTHRANQIVAEAILAGTIPGIGPALHIRPEAPLPSGHGRCDLLVDTAEGPCIIEVKNVTLLEPISRLARFPDARTERGERHLRELTAIALAGNRAAIVFLVSHTGANSFAPASSIDPHFAQALQTAKQAGVCILPMGTCVQQHPQGWEISITRLLPWSLT